jgi:hypothetical protein
MYTVELQYSWTSIIRILTFCDHLLCAVHIDFEVLAGQGDMSSCAVYRYVSTIGPSASILAWICLSHNGRTSQRARRCRACPVSKSATSWSIWLQCFIVPWPQSTLTRRGWVWHSINKGIENLHEMSTDIVVLCCVNVVVTGTVCSTCGGGSVSKVTSVMIISEKQLWHSVVHYDRELLLFLKIFPDEFDTLQTSLKILSK